MRRRRGILVECRRGVLVECRRGILVECRRNILVECRRGPSVRGTNVWVRASSSGRRVRVAESSCGNVG